MVSKIVVESVSHDLFIFDNRIPFGENNCISSLAFISKSWLYRFPKYFGTINPTNIHVIKSIPSLFYVKIYA